MRQTGQNQRGQADRRKLSRRHGAPLLARFVGKFVLDIMPAALASVIGGFLFTQYQFGHAPAKPALEQVTPASAEMMALVRDEHAMIIDYLKTQMAAEKSRVAVADADLARAQVDSKLSDSNCRTSRHRPQRRLSRFWSPRLRPSLMPLRPGLTPRRAVPRQLRRPSRLSGSTRSRSWRPRPRRRRCRVRRW